MRKTEYSDSNLYYRDVWHNEDGTDHLIMFGHPRTLREEPYGSKQLDFIAERKNVKAFALEMAILFSTIARDLDE